MLMLAALLGAGLACSRADVPLEAAYGSGGIPSVTSPAPIQTSEPTENPLTIPTFIPTSNPAELGPVVSPTFPPTPTFQATEEIEELLYESQPGDTLNAVAVRFGVVPQDIQSPEPLPLPKKHLDPGQLLIIPGRFPETGPDLRLLPDSEVIFSPHVTDFDVSAFAEQRGGYLARYQEYLGGGWLSGSEINWTIADQCAA